MTALDELARCGLQAAGAPPVIRLMVAGTEVRISVEDEGGLVRSRTRASLREAVSSFDLAAAGLSLPGDTSLELVGTDMSASRVLVDPSVAVLYDAVHELAKATVLVSILRDDRTGIFRR